MRAAIPRIAHITDPFRICSRVSHRKVSRRGRVAGNKWFIREHYWLKVASLKSKLPFRSACIVRWRKHDVTVFQFWTHTNTYGHCIGPNSEKFAISRVKVWPDVWRRVHPLRYLCRRSAVIGRIEIFATYAIDCFALVGSVSNALTTQKLATTMPLTGIS